MLLSRQVENHAMPCPKDLFRCLVRYVCCLHLFNTELMPSAAYLCLFFVSKNREIWLILDERERIDAMDEQEGQKPQDMVRSTPRGEV